MQHEVSMDDLSLLADLIKAKNAVDNVIAKRVGRPAQIGHVGEFIAAAIFGIALNNDAAKKDYDGSFISGQLAGCTVNIKWYTKHEGLLDVKEDSSTDYYLVLAGPRSVAGPSRGGVRPWIIESVFLFNAHKLVETLRQRGIKIGIATSVIGELWKAAEVYPAQRSGELILSDEQKAKLALFGLGV